MIEGNAAEANSEMKEEEEVEEEEVLENHVTFVEKNYLARMTSWTI